MLCRSLAAGAHPGPGRLSLSAVFSQLQRVTNVKAAAASASSIVVPRRGNSFYSRAHLGLDDLDRRREQLVKRYTRDEVDAIRSQGQHKNKIFRIDS